MTHAGATPVTTRDTRPDRPQRPIRRRVLRPAWVGMFFLWTSGIHVGIVAADTRFYRHVADRSPVPGVTAAWHDLFMGHPHLWGLLLAAGEMACGVLLLARARLRRLGWVAVIAFHVTLLVFGWGFWLWSVPALALLVPAAVADWTAPPAGTARSSAARPLGAER